MAFKRYLKTEKDFLKCKYVYCRSTQSAYKAGECYLINSIIDRGDFDRYGNRIFLLEFYQENRLYKVAATNYGGEFIFTPFFTSKQEYMKETDY